MMFRSRNTVFLLFILVFYLATDSIAQKRIVSGTVRDINTHREIDAVNIFVKDTKIGTISDIAGKFSLEITEPASNPVIVFQHIGYEPHEILLNDLISLRFIELQPRVIPLPVVKTEAEGYHLEIERDLPQKIAILNAEQFEIRGFIDAGDLLRTNHSVQIEEDLSGKKTAAMRGGNADEIVVLYNGIRLNSSYDNIFNLSLIDLEDVKRLELIKGSNTALYGPQAFSGVINIVPKIEHDYNVRFQQRIGSYSSGNYGLHLYHNFNRFHYSYNFKNGASVRDLVGFLRKDARMENSGTHHTANISYDLSDTESGTLQKHVSLIFMHSVHDYLNYQDYNEESDNTNQMLSLIYSGDLLWVKDLQFSISRRIFQEKNNFFRDVISINRDIDDHAIYLNLEKNGQLALFKYTFAYQYQQADLKLLDLRAGDVQTLIGLESVELKRKHHGIVSILKLIGDNTTNSFDVSTSLRYDNINDQPFNPVYRNTKYPPKNNPVVLSENDWQATTVKLASNYYGYHNNFRYNSYLNFGANVKFPTLFQQISAQGYHTNPAYNPSLEPEKNRSMEIGISLTREMNIASKISGWQISANYFRNYYDNKFRMYTMPSSPIAYYDNVKDAHIFGTEATSSVFMFRKKATIEFGISRYSISEKAAFPFKSDLKYTLNLYIDHAGYSFQLHWFNESEQTGWLRNLYNEFEEVNLPEFDNIDLHLSKTFAVGKFKFFFNISGRNLLNDDTLLQGLAIRDRRYYLTFGAQY